MNTKSRYEELKSEIHMHNYRYHVLDAPIISDLEFDKIPSPVLFSVNHDRGVIARRMFMWS